MTTNKPLSVNGLISYRCKTPFGWCMIGAKNDVKNPKKEDLQVWNGFEYVPVIKEDLQ